MRRGSDEVEARGARGGSGPGAARVQRSSTRLGLEVALDPRALGPTEVVDRAGDEWLVRSGKQGGKRRLWLVVWIGRGLGGSGWIPRRIWKTMAGDKTEVLDFRVG